MRFSLSTFVLSAAVALASGTATAQHKPGAPRLARTDGSTGAGTNDQTVRSAPVMLRRGGNAVTLTQSASQDVLFRSGVACPTPPNSIYRVFGLAEYGLGTDGLAVTSVDVGVETSSTGFTTVRLHRLDGAFTRANLEFVAETPLEFEFPQNLVVRNVPITGTFGPSDRLVVEWASSDFFPVEEYYFGGNAAGQSGPTYIAAEACGNGEPVDASTLGFPGSHWVVNVHGTTNPVVGPSLRVFPGTLIFEETVTGGVSVPQTVTLANDGTEPVTVAQVAASGAPFPVDLAGADLTLDPGQSTTVRVRFAPDAAGAALGMLTVASNADDSPATVELRGTSRDRPANDDRASATPVPRGTFVGSNVFATVEPGEPVASCADFTTASAWWRFTPQTTEAVTVSTAGSAFNTVLSLHRPDGPEIACADNGAGLQSLIENVVLPAGEPVLIRVASFAEAPPGRIVLAVSTADDVAGLTITPAAVDFGGVGVGSSATQTVRIANTGPLAVRVEGVAFDGPAAFVGTTPPQTDLLPGDSLSFRVTFTPVEVGPTAGTVFVFSDAPDSPQTVAVLGTGTDSGGTTTTTTSADTPVAIPDNDAGGVSSTIVVSDVGGVVLGLDVVLDVAHTWVGELTATLTHGPASAVLFDRIGASIESNGCTGDDVDVTLDDAAGVSLVESCTTGDPGVQAFVPGGRYRPAALLTTFNGTPAAGAYTLALRDGTNQDTGTLDSWALVLTSSGGVAGELGSDAPASRLSVAPNPVASTGQITLSVATGQDVRVALYDAIGREARVLFSRTLAAGQTAVVAFGTAGLPPGVYFVRARGEGGLDVTERITVVR